MCSTTPLFSTISTMPEQGTQVKPMNESEFQQFCQSLDDQSFESWLLSSDWIPSPETCHQPSPEIATPADVFLTSLTGQIKSPSIPMTATDLEVSALLHTLTTTTFVSTASTLSQGTPSLLSVPVPEVTLSQATHSLFADLPAGDLALASTQQHMFPEQPSQVFTRPATGKTSQKRQRTVDLMQPVEQLDEAAIKRQKNTDAARRSRLRKAMKMEGLEQRAAALEKSNTHLLLRAAVMESEKTALINKESTYQQRIRALEKQLAEAHKALANFSSSRS